MSQRSPGRVPRPRGRAAAAILVCAGILTHPGAAAAAIPAASPGPGDAPRVVASGPFGIVPGVPLDREAPTPDPSTLEVLDAWGRNARVSLTAGEWSFDAWSVTAMREPVAAGIAPDDLGSGTGPPALHLPTTGLFLIRLDATLSDSTVSDDVPSAGSWLWRIAVPDRDVPGGGDPYPPAPAILLASGDDQVELDPGSGCFVGTCGDIGATSPPRTLPTIRTRAGAPLVIRLGDGSSMVAWTARASPVGGPEDQAVELGANAGVAPVTQGTFAAPTEGRWVILVHVRFDRDRGTFDGYGRLILDEADRSS